MSTTILPWRIILLPSLNTLHQSRRIMWLAAAPTTVITAHRSIQIFCIRHPRYLSICLHLEWWCFMRHGEKYKGIPLTHTRTLILLICPLSPSAPFAPGVPIASTMYQNTNNWQPKSCLTTPPLNFMPLAV